MQNQKSTLSIYLYICIKQISINVTSYHVPETPVEIHVVGVEVVKGMCGVWCLTQL